MKNTDVHKMLKPLIEDVDASLAMTPDSQFRRRTIYRTIFAAIEGHIEHIGYVSYHFGEGINTAQEKVCELRGKRITKNNKIANMSFKARIDRNLKELIQTLAPDLTLDKTTEWDELLKAAKVRDRLTHPKKVQNLEVSDMEMTQLGNGWNWFTKTLCKITDEALKKQ